MRETKGTGDTDMFFCSFVNTYLVDDEKLGCLGYFFSLFLADTSFHAIMLLVILDSCTRENCH